MQSSSTDDPPDPPEVRSAVSSEPDEMDIDVDDSPADECLGEYPTVDDYLRSVLEEFIAAEARWILDCLDMTKVLRRFENNGRHAYRCIHGRIYRTTR